MTPPDRTAHIAEDPFGLPVRYSVHLDEPHHQGPEAATVDECVEWGLGRADRVVIRMGERFFLAGRRRDTDTAEIPAWPPSPMDRHLADREVEVIAHRLARNLQPHPGEDDLAGPPPEVLPPGPWTATRDHDGTWTIVSPAGGDADGAAPPGR